MKKRLPAVQRAFDTLLASNMRGQLQTGDSIGVWTFDREVRTGTISAATLDAGERRDDCVEYHAVC